MDASTLLCSTSIRIVQPPATYKYQCAACRPSNMDASTLLCSASIRIVQPPATYKYQCAACRPSNMDASTLLCSASIRIVQPPATYKYQCAACRPSNMDASTLLCSASIRIVQPPATYKYQCAACRPSNMDASTLLCSASIRIVQPPATYKYQCAACRPSNMDASTLLCSASIRIVQPPATYKYQCAACRPSNVDASTLLCSASIRIVQPRATYKYQCAACRPSNMDASTLLCSASIRIVQPRAGEEDQRKTVGIKCADFNKLENLKRVDGLGKCTHASGLLFAVEDFTRRGLKSHATPLSLTSRLSVWNVPRNDKVEPQPISKITIRKIRFGKNTKRPTCARYDPSESVLSTIKAENPMLCKVFLRSDNAGCYHCAPLLLSMPAISQKTGISVLRYDFSDPQAGKDICDRKIVSMETHIRRFVNERHDVVTAEDMKQALESHGGVKGCRVAVCQLTPGQEHPGLRLEGIKVWNNFSFEGEVLRVWKPSESGKTHHITEGWALRQFKRGQRMSDKTKSYLTDIFNEGATSGQKADAAQVAQQILTPGCPRLALQTSATCATINLSYEESVINQHRRTVSLKDEHLATLEGTPTSPEDQAFKTRVNCCINNKAATTRTVAALFWFHGEFPRWLPGLEVADSRRNTVATPNASTTLTTSGNQPVARSARGISRPGRSVLPPRAERECDPAIALQQNHCHQIERPGIPKIVTVLSGSSSALPALAIPQGVTARNAETPWVSDNLKGGWRWRADFGSLLIVFWSLGDYRQQEERQ
ncbi:hypothetical protein Bbelb_344020 [Branchiostoma belcheri]|nr:hypothetical protein Bbelb_344020 [Branchiostoma belcheri]